MNVADNIGEILKSEKNNGTYQGYNQKNGDSKPDIKKDFTKGRYASQVVKSSGDNGE
jgi:hypothetical protein